MKKRRGLNIKRVFLAVAGLFLVLILAFLTYFKLGAARERYCLYQTHARFPMIMPMEGAKWDFYTSCFQEIGWIDALGFLSIEPMDAIEDQRQQDMVAIRNFMGNQNLDLTFLHTSHPTFFTIGTATELDGGMKIEQAKEWERWVNVYEQSNYVDDTCSVYQYEVDPRRHSLVKVHIRNLSYAEIEALNEEGKTCGNSNPVPKISKTKAETVAKQYLGQILPNFEEMWDQFTYTEQVKNEAHSWLWEDKKYQLPEGLTGDIYSYPTIQISVYGDGWLSSYQNTVSLFEEYNE